MAKGSQNPNPKNRRNGDYEVGYGKPPKHTQFPPGQSGNPKGKPKGTKDFRADLAEELAQRVQVSEGGKKITVSKQRLVIKRLFEKAAKGDIRALNTVIKLGMTTMSDDTAAADEPLTAEEEEILRLMLGDDSESDDGNDDSGDGNNNTEGGGDDDQ